MMTKTLLALTALLFLAACGSTPGERALSGGAIGAATGVAVGAVTGATLLEGALVGGAIGAVTGAVTTPDQVNLGKPVWRR